MAFGNRVYAGCLDKKIEFLIETRCPMGHMPDTDIRCFRSIRVGISTAANKAKFARLRPSCQSLEKHLYFPGEHFLIIMTGVEYKGF